MKHSSYTVWEFKVSTSSIPFLSLMGSSLELHGTLDFTLWSVFKMSLGGIGLGMAVTLGLGTFWLWTGAEIPSIVTLEEVNGSSWGSSCLRGSNHSICSSQLKGTWAKPLRTIWLCEEWGGGGSVIGPCCSREPVNLTEVSLRISDTINLLQVYSGLSDGAGNGWAFAFFFFPHRLSLKVGVPNFWVDFLCFESFLGYGWLAAACESLYCIGSVWRI